MINPKIPSPILEDIQSSFEYYSNISYDKYNRTTIDYFFAKGVNELKPKPCVVFFHGGGFAVGDKEPIQYSQERQDLIRLFILNKISFMYVNYRLLSIEGEKNNALKCFKSGLKAIDFIFQNALSLKINENSICFLGSSAGCGLILQNLYYGTYTPKCTVLLSPLATYDTLSGILSQYGYDPIIDIEENENSKKSYFRTAGITNVSEFNLPNVIEFRNITNFYQLQIQNVPDEVFLETLNQPFPLYGNPTNVAHHYKSCLLLKSVFSNAGALTKVNIPTAPPNEIITADETYEGFIVRCLNS